VAIPRGYAPPLDSLGTQTSSSITTQMLRPKALAQCESLRQKTWRGLTLPQTESRSSTSKYDFDFRVLGDLLKTSSYSLVHV
jgi:hypothetical protein